MKRPDHRSRAEVLRHERWDSLIGDPGLEAASLADLRALDTFLAHLEAEQIGSILELTKRHFLAYDSGYRSVGRLRALKQAMARVFPGNIALLALTDAIREKEADYDAQRRPPKGGQRRLNKSVPEAELPAAWRAALSDMAAGFDRNGELPPAPAMMKTHVMKLRQLLCSARKAGLDDALSVATVRSYARDMRDRELAAATLRASFSALLKFARYTSADAAVIALLAELHNIYEAKARTAPKKKYERLHETGYSPAALINLAKSLLDETPSLPTTREQHGQRNRAAAIALFSVMTVRLADTRLAFGESIAWQDDGYLVDLSLSKTGEQWTALLDERLTPFIDALILRGCDPAWLPHMRKECHARKRPLFVTSSGEPVAYNYVSDAWRAELGTGEHIARTVIHTFLGIELGLAGIDMAKAACGQRADGIEKEYQGDALAKAQRLKGQAEIAALPDDDAADLFALK